VQKGDGKTAGRSAAPRGLLEADPASQARPSDHLDESYCPWPYPTKEGNYEWNLGPYDSTTGFESSLWSRAARAHGAARERNQVAFPRLGNLRTRGRFTRTLAPAQATKFMND
jgi:hypothetical protein